MSGRIKDIILVILAIAVLWLGYERLHEKPVPEVVNVPQVSTQEIQRVVPEMNRHDAERTTRIIERTVTKEVPIQTWYASSESAADAKAQEIAKEQKADTVVKHIEEKPVEGSDEKIIEADYYGINLERKHRIKVGAAVINDEPYGSLTYQNRDLEYTAYIGQDKYGAGIQYTIAKW